MFLEGKLSYLGISEAIGEAMARVKNIQNPSIDEIWAADKEAREIVYNIAKGASI